MFFIRICFTDDCFVALGMKSYKYLTMHHDMALPNFETVSQQLARFKVQNIHSKFLFLKFSKKKSIYWKKNGK
jgi:hypothetical protein